jgi:hypothetical protein
MLEGIKQGAQVEVFATDDLPTFVDVFGKYMRQREYYLLPQATQDYIRDVYISASSYQPLPPGASPAEQRMNMKVFPKQPPLDNAQQLTADILTASPQAQDQNLAQVIQGRQFQGAASAIVPQAKTLKGVQPSDEDVIARRGLT